MKHLALQLGAHRHVVILTAALLVGALARAYSLALYGQFRGDEATDAAVIAGFRHGIWPTLGPAASIEPYSELPLYYYLVAPALVFGDAPAALAIPNAVIAVLTIPLLYRAICLLLSDVAPSRRRTIAAIGAFWWAVTFLDLALSTHEWNPSPIPFFTVALALLWTHQTRPNRSNLDRSFTALAVGACLAIMVSLHASALFVIPAAFVIVSGIRIVSAPRSGWAWGEAVLAVFAALVLLTPYWIGEAERGWTNTGAILASLHSGHGTLNRSLGPLHFVSSAARAYFGLAAQFVMPAAPLALTLFAALMLAMLPVLALRGFRGDRALLVRFLVVWAVFLFAAGNEATHYPHYNLLIAPAPLLLAAVVLGRLGLRTPGQRAAALSTGALVACSLAANVRLDRAFLLAASADPRPPAVRDVTTLLRALPPGIPVCEVRTVYVDGPVVDYIAQRLAAGPRPHVGCRIGDLVIDARYGYAWQDFANPQMTDFRVVERAAPSDELRRAVGRDRLSLVETYPLFYVYRVDSAPSAAALAP